MWRGYPSRRAYHSGRDAHGPVADDRRGAGRAARAAGGAADGARRARARGATRVAHAGTGAPARARAGVTAAPDIATPLVAFRSWRLSGDRLVSPFIPCRWDGRVMHATCYDANRTL